MRRDENDDPCDNDTVGFRVSAKGLLDLTEDSVVAGATPSSGVPYVSVHHLLSDSRVRTRVIGHAWYRVLALLRTHIFVPQLHVA